MFSTCRNLISVTLAQGDINSTIYFTVQYRGDNLAAPVLDYNATGSHVHTLWAMYDNYRFVITQVTMLHTERVMIV